MVEAGYVVGSYVLLLGAGPFIWNPLSHSYGRRPIYIVGIIGSLAAAIGCGLSRRYEILIILRALNGLFAGAAIGLGTVVCCDIFYAHQRGLYLGLYMVFHMIGGQLGPTAGGFIFRKVNWHWCFYIPAIIAAALLIPLILAFPETLYSRSVECLKQPRMSEYQKERLRKKRRESRELRFHNFTRQFKMLRYPSVLIPAVFYAVASGYGNMVFVISSAILFRRTYHFHTWQIGMLLGIPLMLGSLIGEAGAGGFSDWVIRRRAVGRGGKRIAEDRLYAMIPGVILLPLGLIVEAYSIHNRTHWVGPGLGIAIASAGLQIVTTVTYAYTADVRLLLKYLHGQNLLTVRQCYSRQVGEIGSILNFGRQIFCFFVGFYAIPFAWKFGLQMAWTVFAIVEILCFLPIIPLMIKGAEWRELFLPPDWNLDL
jgi:multidrug resistance protein